MELVIESLEPKCMPVTLAGKKYMLREPSGDAAVRYRNLAAKAAKMVDGKVVGVDGIADAEPYLVSCCLFEVTDRGETPVSLHTIRSWVGSVQKRLFAEVKELAPWLVDKEDTVAELDKRIAELQKKRQELLEGTSLPKGSPSPTEGSSE